MRRCRAIRIKMATPATTGWRGMGATRFLGPDYATHGSAADAGRSELADAVVWNLPRSRSISSIATTDDIGLSDDGFYNSAGQFVPYRQQVGGELTIQLIISNLQAS